MNDELRPIMLFAVILILLGLGGTVFFLFATSPAPFFDPSSAVGVERALFYLVLAHNVFYVAAGIGLIMRKKWGFILFKCFLFVAFLAFPIGTIVSYITLSYIKKHRLDQRFL